jgi:hypothetical protein
MFAAVESPEPDPFRIGTYGLVQAWRDALESDA